MTPDPSPSLRRCTIALLAVVVWLGAAPAGAQEGAADEPTIPGIVEVYLGLTRIAGVTSGQGGGAALLGFGHGVRVGGGVWTILRRVDEGPVLTGSGLALSVGYGGAIAEVDIPRTYLAGRLIVGGGAATMRTRAVGTRFDTETFVVVEPGMVAAFPLGWIISGGATASYRMIRGADALFLIEDQDLRGFQASVFLRLGGR
jgi:hypothetical protein